MKRLNGTCPHQWVSKGISPYGQHRQRCKICGGHRIRPDDYVPPEKAQNAREIALCVNHKEHEWKRNGLTDSSRTRWRCKVCGISKSADLIAKYGGGKADVVEQEQAAITSAPLSATATEERKS